MRADRRTFFGHVREGVLEVLLEFGVASVKEVDDRLVVAADWMPGGGFFQEDSAGNFDFEVVEEIAGEVTVEVYNVGVEGNGQGGDGLVVRTEADDIGGEGQAVRAEEVVRAAVALSVISVAKKY